MDLGTVVGLISVLSLVVERFCEFLYQLISLIFSKVGAINSAWKPLIVFVLSVVGCLLLSLDAFPAMGLYFAYPFPWIGSLMTGILVGSGADLLHLAKNKLEPMVKA